MIGNAQSVTTYSYAQSVNSAGYAALSTGTTLCTGTGAGTSNSFYQGGAVNTAGAGIPIGFTFVYNCGSYSTIGVHTNGFIWFGSGTPSPTVTKIWEQNSNLNGSGTINGVIAAYSGHSNSGGTAQTMTPSAAGSYVRYQLSGTSPNQIMKIEWRGYFVPSNASSATVPAYEIWLYETSNKIEIHVCNQNSLFLSTTSYGQSGIRGLSNADLRNLSIPFTGANTTWSISSPTTTTTATLPIDGASFAIYSNPSPSSTGERIFTFNPTQSCCTQPATGATAFTSSSLDAANGTGTIEFTRGSGDGGVIVIAKDGSAPSGPSNGTGYTPANANTAYGSGTPLGGGFIVFVENGSGSGVRTINLSNLTSGHSYYFAVYEYNSAATCYVGTPLSGGFCIGPPAVSSISSTANPVCQGSSATLSLTGLSAGTFYTYQWQNSATSGSGYGNSTGSSTTSTYATPTTLPSNPSYYVCQVTCPYTSQSTQSNELTESVNSFINCYCIPTYAASNGGTRGITQVILNGVPGINNSTTVNSTAPYYTLYTGASPISNAGISVNNSYTLSVKVGTQANAINNVGAWIDYNQDGTFSSSEFLGSFTNAAASTTTNIVFSVPPTATSGNTAMRVRHRYGAAVGSTEACTGYTGTAAAGGAGEVEDYRVSISSCTPPSVQTSGNSMGAINTTDATINWSGNGNGDAVIVVLNQGSAPTAPSQSLSYAGNSDFTVAPIVSGTTRAVYTGTGSSVTVTGLLTNTTYFYSIYTYFTGTNCYNVISPASGSFTTANSPMVYLSSTTTQTLVTSVSPSSVNNRIIGIQVVTSSGTSPALNLTSLTFNTNGSTNTADIAAAKIWYTGTSSTFATTTQFGATVSNPSGSNTVSGSQALSPGTNYFWLTYDIAATPTATVGDVVDAECTSVNAGGAQSPSVTAPAGNRTILLVYCTPSPGATPCSGGGDDAILSVAYNGVGSTFNYTGGSCSNGTYGIDNYTGDISIGNTYTTTVVKGNNSGPSSSFGARFIVFMDLNNDGDFTDIVSGTNEMVMDVVQNASTANSASFIIPSVGVAPGLHKIRVWIAYTGTIVQSDYLTIATGCETLSSFSNQGQIRDFNINLVGGCTAPVIGACPSDITQCDNAIATWSTPTATGTTPTVTCVPASGSTFAAGTTAVTCTATNACGSSSCSFNVTINQSPVIGACPSNITQCDNHVATFSTPTSTGTPAATVTCVPASGSTFVTGTTAVTCTATNACGSSSCSFSVTINESPVIGGCPDDIFQCDNHVVTYSSPSSSGTPAATVTCVPASGSTFATGTTAVTCTATNSCGSSSCSFNVTINLSPVIGACPNDITQCDNHIATWTDPTSTGSPAAVVTCVPASGSTFAAGTTTVTCTATNTCGSSSCSFSVTINDSPVIGACPTDITTCNPVVTFATPASSGTPAAVVTCVPASGSTFIVGTTAVTCTATNSCGSSTCSFNVNVQSSSVAATGINSNAAGNEICLGNNISMTLTGGSLGQGAVWTWYEGGCGTGASLGTGTTLTLTPATAGVHVYYVRAEGTCNTTLCASISVNVKTLPPNGTIHLTSAPTDGCVGNTATISVNAVPTATFYRWTCANGGILFNGMPGPYDSSTPTVNISYTALPAGGGSGWSICVFPGNACGNSNTICAWIRATISRPAQITGSVIGCPNSSSTYSCAAVTGAASYQWTVTGDATITNNGNQTITVNFGPAFNGGTLCVHSQTSCGYNSTDLCMTIGTITAMPGAITGPSNVCPNASSSFSVAAVSGATSYIWTTSVPGAIVTGNTTSCSILFPTTIPGGATVCVQSVGACGIPSGQRCKGIATGLPGVPANISGPSSGRCGQTGVSYSIPPVTGATSYLWTVNNGATISGPNNISAISVDFPANFTSVVITVYAINACGNGGTRSLTVTAAPLIPGAITGSSSVCNGQVDFYNTSGSTGATAYIWTVPAGSLILSGQNTASLVVLFGPTSGNITVKAQNPCGTSPIRSYPVSIVCRESQVAGTTEEKATEIYPNPTTGKVSIRFNEDEDELVSLRIMDMTGREWITDELKSVSGVNVHEIDLSAFAKGIYMIQLKGKEMNEMLKVTVE